jgi:hypothetical protein
MDGTTEDLPIGGQGAQDKIAEQHRRLADAASTSAAALAASAGMTPRERYLNILIGCLSGRVFAGESPSIEAFLRAADEFSDGVNERFPAPPPEQ